MPRRKSQNTAAQIAELLDKSWSDGTTDVVPLSTPADVARYYQKSSKNQFYVPGYNAPTQKMQVFIDRNQPFTRTTKVRDPITGMVRETGLGSKKTVGEWLNMFLLQLNGQLETYKTLKYDTEKATEWINQTWGAEGGLAELYTHIRQLSNSKYVSDVQRGRARKALEKIGSLARVGVDHTLASKIEAAGKAAFSKSMDILEKMVANPDDGSLSGAEASALLASLLSIASENPKYANEKEKLMDTKQKLAEAEKVRIVNDSQKLIGLVTEITELEADKSETVKQVVLRQLRSAKGEFSVMINTKTWKPATQDAFAVLLVELLKMKQQKSSAHLYAVAKAFEKHYAPATFSAGQFDPKFFSASSKSVLSQFSAAGEATSTYQRLAKVPVAGKVCESIEPGVTVEFFKLYGQYHEIMPATLIFYYTSCSPTYKSKDITALAEDWATWLRTGPFHMVDLPKVRDMRPEVWNRIAPQSFLQFALTIQDAANPYDPVAAADRMGIKWNDIKETRETFQNNFNQLIALANQISDACTLYEKTPAEPGKPKAPLSEQSKRVLFLANFTRNAAAILGGLRKAGTLAINWVKDSNSNTVTRSPTEGVQAYCEFNLEQLGKKYRPAAGEAPPPPETTTTAAQPEPQVILAPALDADPDIIFNLHWPKEVQIATSQQTNGNFQGKDPLVSTMELLGQDYNDDEPIAELIARIAGKPRFAWVNGEPVDSRVLQFSGFTSADAKTIGEWLKNKNIENSKYALPITKAYRSDALQNGKIVIEISQFPTEEKLDEEIAAI